MAITQERAKEMAVRILDNTRKGVLGQGELGSLEFVISADDKTASLFVMTFPRQDDAGHMSLMLAMSEQVAPISDARKMYDDWSYKHQA